MTNCEIECATNSLMVSTSLTTVSTMAPVSPVEVGVRQSLEVVVEPRPQVGQHPIGGDVVIERVDIAHRPRQRDDDESGGAPGEAAAASARGRELDQQSPHQQRRASARTTCASAAATAMHQQTAPALQQAERRSAKRIDDAPRAGSAFAVDRYMIAEGTAALPVIMARGAGVTERTRSLMAWRRLPTDCRAGT